MKLFCALYVPAFSTDAGKSAISPGFLDHLETRRERRATPKTISAIDIPSRNPVTKCQKFP
jgi:hypothetical protein